MTDETIATTGEILSLTGYTAPRLTQLEAAGVIKRAGRNEWPLRATVLGIIKHLRDENRRGSHSEAANKLAAAKAKSLELRTARELAELVPIRAASDAMAMLAGGVVSRLAEVLPNFTRDIAERRRLEQLINDRVRTPVADLMEAEAKRLEEEAIKTARRRS